MSFETISLEKRGEIAIITLITPENENRLTDKNTAEMLLAVEDIKNDTDIRVVILAGEGEFFIRGADVKCFTDFDGVRATLFCNEVSRLEREIEMMDKIFIATMKSTVFGGGFEFSLACDFRIMADNTKVALPETALGCIAGSSAHQRLPRLVGTAKAMEFLVAGIVIDAEEALRLGLATKVVPLDNLMDAALELANTILTKAPWATVFSKRAVMRGRDMNIYDALEYDNALFGMSFTTGETEEGFDAYFNGRKPTFKKGLKA